MRIYANHLRLLQLLLTSFGNGIVEKESMAILLEYAGELWNRRLGFIVLFLIIIFNNL